MPHRPRAARAAGALALALAWHSSRSRGVARPRAVRAARCPPGLSQLLAAYSPPAPSAASRRSAPTPRRGQVGALAAARPDRPADAPPAARARLRARLGAAAGGRHRRRWRSDVYPDERDRAARHGSADAMGAAALRAAGLTGKGVTVAVVDSRLRRRHPDLADHVVHNVKLYSGEYANLPPDSSTRSSSPNEIGPYQNTDIGSGHGTHVAGIIAADSTTDPTGGRLGVAPDAEPRLLLGRRGPVHDRGRDRLRPHARPARPVGRRRRQQLVGQLVPAVRPAPPGRRRDEGRRRPRRGRRLRRRQQRLRARPR